MRYYLTMSLIIVALGCFAALFVTLNHGHLNTHLIKTDNEK